MAEDLTPPTFQEFEEGVSLTIDVKSTDPADNAIVVEVGNVTFSSAGYKLNSVSFNGSQITISFDVGEVFARTLHYLGDDEKIHIISGAPVFAKLPESYITPTFYRIDETGLKSDSLSVEYKTNNYFSENYILASGNFYVSDNWSWANQKLKEAVANGRY